MKSTKIKIALDSSVFRDLDFIEYLQNNSNRFLISISVIAYLETYHWYNVREIPEELFEQEISALNAEIKDLYTTQTKEISDNVRNSKLRFKHHVRDIIIATHSNLENSQLITFNVKHFQWMTVKPLTPDEFIETFTANGP